MNIRPQSAVSPSDGDSPDRPLWQETALVITVSLVAMVSMLPYLGIATLLGIDMSKLSGHQFQFQAGPILLFFCYGSTVVLVIALAQKYLHRRKWSDLGFRAGFFLPLLAGSFLGIVIKATALGIIVLNAENYSFRNIVPSDISWSSYVLHYIYFLIGFITLNSFIEELATRAYPFESLRKRIHPVCVAIAFSVIFTVGHLFVNSFSVPYVLSLLLFGLLFAFVYYQSDSIWAVVGMHNGINWFTFTFYGSTWKVGHVYETTITGTPQWIADSASWVAYVVGFAIAFCFFRLSLRGQQPDR